MHLLAVCLAHRRGLWLLDPQDLVPPQLITLRTLQFCQPHVRHRYCLAESDEALYVGIMGTKMR